MLSSLLFLNKHERGNVNIFLDKTKHALIYYLKRGGGGGRKEREKRGEGRKSRGEKQGRKEKNKNKKPGGAEGDRMEKRKEKKQETPLIPRNYHGKVNKPIKI